jgi:hypothetical protein
MKVRILFRPPGGLLACGEVYDLADGAHLVAAGEAEAVGKSEKALPDPRPEALVPAEAAPAADSDA